MAARAHIRHRYTKYEDELSDLPFQAWDEDDLYREIKGAAHQAVDDFVEERRQQYNHYYMPTGRDQRP